MPFCNWIWREIFFPWQHLPGHDHVNLTLFNYTYPETSSATFTHVLNNAYSVTRDTNFFPVALNITIYEFQQVMLCHIIPSINSKRSLHRSTEYLYFAASWTIEIFFPARKIFLQFIFHNWWGRDLYHLKLFCVKTTCLSHWLTLIFEWICTTR